LNYAITENGKWKSFMNNLTNEESKKDKYMFIKIILDINKIFVGHSLTSK